MLLRQLNQLLRKFRRNDMTRQLLSKIPAINKILLLDEIQDLIESYNEVAVKSAIKKSYRRS